MKLRIQRLHPDAKLPLRASSGAAGYDLIAVSVKHDPELRTWTYDIGLAFEIPEGYEGQLRPRSSIYKTGAILANSVGTLDSDYRGPVKLVFLAHSQPYQVGDRIAQLIIAKVETANFEVVDDLSITERNQGGFGSTGNGSLGYGKL